MRDCIYRDAAIKLFNFAVLDCLGMEPTIRAGDIIKALESIPAADVPPALWTDEPIIGTEFMTHNQGQHGFEIHFRTDNKEKYEAVQSECRRQIGHAKPAADVREVKRGKWVYDIEPDMFRCSVCNGFAPRNDYPFCHWCGADMRPPKEET